MISLGIFETESGRRGRRGIAAVEKPNESGHSKVDKPRLDGTCLTSKEEGFGFNLIINKLDI